jgi:pyrimidine deaminase RibD-like protein
MRFFLALFLLAATAVEQITAFGVLLPMANHHRLAAITTVCQVAMDENVEATKSLVKDAINNSLENEVNSQKEKGSRHENDVNVTVNGMNVEQQIDNEVVLDEKEDEEEATFDVQQMRHAIHLAQLSSRSGGDPYPKPIAGAVIVDKHGKILGKGRSDYHQDCIRAAIADAGLMATPLREWCVSWPSNRALREALAQSTLYTTLEPSDRAQGEALPPITQLIEQSGIPRVVIGCADPIPERAMEGAARLHSAGISVSLGVEQQDCEQLIEEYAQLANSKLQVMSRKFAERFGRVRHVCPTCVLLVIFGTKLIIICGEYIYSLLDSFIAVSWTVIMSKPLPVQAMPLAKTLGERIYHPETLDPTKLLRRPRWSGRKVRMTMISKQNWIASSTWSLKKKTTKIVWIVAP